MIEHINSPSCKNAFPTEPCTLWERKSATFVWDPLRQWKKKSYVVRKSIHRAILQWLPSLADEAFKAGWYENKWKCSDRSRYSVELWSTETKVDASRSHVEKFHFAPVNVLLAQRTECTILPLLWNKTEPIETGEAPVWTQKDSSKSGKVTLTAMSPLL